MTRPGEGVFPYAYGSLVDLVAVPDDHHHFVAWAVEDAETGIIQDAGAPRTVILLRGDSSVTARFALDTFSLVVTASEGGTATSLLPRPDEGYPYGTMVPIEAVAAEGYRFAGWTGSGVAAGRVEDPAQPVTAIFMDGNYAVTATFEAEAPPDDNGGGGCSYAPPAFPMGPRDILGWCLPFIAGCLILMVCRRRARRAASAFVTGTYRM